MSSSRLKTRLLVQSMCAATIAIPLAAHAQDNQTVPPTLDDFTLQPGRNQTQPVTPPVIVVPTVPQNQTTPAPVPPPTPAPAPAPSPTPSPAPAPAPAPSPSPAPVEQPDSDPEPAETAPPVDEAPQPAPSAEPANEAPATPVPDAAPTAPAAEPDGGRGWIYIGIAVIASIAALLWWRRRRTRVDAAVSHDEPAAAPPAEAEPVPAQQPDEIVDMSVAEPTVPVEPPPVVAPVAGRPWIDLELRPIKAGVNVMDALVEFDLTVTNSGDVAAQDVQIAAWLLSANANQDAEVARFLDNLPAEAIMTPFSVEPGESKRVDAAIALPRTGLSVVTARDRPFFVPLVIADARYGLPDGGQGRTSATYVVGTALAGQQKLGPIWLDRGVRMHDDVQARLHAELART